MGEQLQMQLCGIITLESILCNCAFNSDVDLYRKLAWCQMHSFGAAVNDLMSVMDAGVLSSQAAHHFKGTSNDSTKDIAELERSTVLWQLNEVYQRVILKHLI